MSVEVRIGFRERDRLTIVVHGRLHPGVQEAESNRWLSTTIQWADSRFSGDFNAYMWDSDFEFLADSFDAAYESLDDDFEWGNLEGDVGLKISGDGMGHFEVKISLTADHLVGPWIESVIEIDQTEIPALVKSLREAAKQ